MKTQVEKLDGDQVKLTITIEQEEVDRCIDKTYKDFASRYKFPGFRPGKAPRPVIDSALGADTILANVTDEITNRFFPLALDEERLLFIEDPVWDDTSIMVEPGKDFVYGATLTLIPELELSSYEPVEIKLPDTEPTEEDIDDRIEALREYYYDLEDAEPDQEVGDRGCCLINLEVTDKDGEVVGVLCADNRMYEIGMGLYPAELDEAIMTMKTGDKKSVTIDLEASGSILTRALDGNPTELTFDIEVLQVKNRILPEVTEEWAKETAGFEGLEDLRKKMKDNLVRERVEYMPRIKENACLYELGERLVGEVPEVMCREERSNLMAAFFKQLSDQGITYDAYLKQREMTNEEFQDDLKKQAEDVVRQNLALDAWARHFNMEVTDEAIQTEFQNSGAEDVEALYAQWVADGRIRTLRQSILRSDATDAVMESAVVETVTAKELAAENAKRKAAAEAEEAEEAPAEEPAAEEAPAEADAE